MAQIFRVALLQPLDVQDPQHHGAGRHTGASVTTQIDQHPSKDQEIPSQQGSNRCPFSNSWGRGSGASGALNVSPMAKARG